MSDRPDAPNDPAGNSLPHAEGPSGTSGSFLPALIQFAKARGELVGIEAREASGILTRRLILLAAALIAAILTYLLLLVTAGWLLNHFLATKLSGDLAAWSPPLTAAILAVLHLLAAILLVAGAKQKSGPPLFEFTRREWQKDRAWLQKETSRNENEH